MPWKDRGGVSNHRSEGASRRERKYLNLLLIVGLPLTAILIVSRLFLWGLYHSPSGSMVPNLMVGDYYLVSKFAYGYSRFSMPIASLKFDERLFFKEPARGDITVFLKPPENRIEYIMRVVGLPGDRIQIWKGILYINRKPVVRRSLEEFVDSFGREIPQFEETLPGGVKHRILESSGDNGVSDNTREFTVPDGHYFMMGDNRDNAMDSRIIGPVPVENLIGRLSIVFWSGRDSGPTWTTPD